MADIRFSTAALADIENILEFSQANFGRDARLRYEYLLTIAFTDIATEPERPGSIVRPELGHGARSYHLRHSRDRAQHSSGVVRHPRHLIIYRVLRPDLIGIGRVLHDSMELHRHMSTDYGDG